MGVISSDQHQISVLLLPNLVQPQDSGLYRAFCRCFVKHGLVAKSPEVSHCTNRTGLSFVLMHGNVICSTPCSYKVKANLFVTEKFNDCLKLV